MEADQQDLSTAAPGDAGAYAALVGEAFSLPSEGGAPALTLTAVKPLIDNEAQRSFSLFFLGAGAVRPQGIHRLRHGRLGEFDLFLVPIQQRKDGIVYEAAFNLLKGGVP